MPDPTGRSALPTRTNLWPDRRSTDVIAMDQDSRMAALIPFTSNYTDVSTYEGYQFEFHCQRCGNGYRSAFRHSVTGFGGRLAALGGGILGGEIGSRVQEVGLLAQWDRSSTRGSTNDKRLLEASEDVAGHFVQCRGCAEWVCRDVCWDGQAGCC